MRATFTGNRSWTCPKCEIRTSQEPSSKRGFRVCMACGEVFAKRRVQVNAWGNWRGYEAGRYVIEFGNSPTGSAEQHARAWAEGKELPKLDISHIKTDAKD